MSGLPRIRQTVVLAGAAVLGACMLVAFPEDSGISFNPDSYNQVVTGPGDIWVEFPFDVDRRTAEDALSVSGVDGRVSGRYQWSGDRLYFLPEPDLARGARYFFELKGDIRESGGPIHELFHLVPFYYGTAVGEVPFIVSTTPGSGETAGPSVPIAVVFSRPMNQNRVRDALSLGPDADYRLEWNGVGTELAIIPEETWPNPSVLALSIDATAVDLEDLPLIQDYDFTFLIQEDTASPGVAAVEATAPEDGFSGPGFTVDQTRRRDALRFTFSERMDREATSSALRINPRPAGRTFWPSGDRLVFVPEEGWTMNTRYRVTLGVEAKDASGNPLTSTWITEFVPAIPVLAVESIDGQADDGFPITSYSAESALLLTPGTPPEYAYTFVIRFSQTFPTAAEKALARRGISLSTLLAPSGSGSPYPVGFSWTADARLSITYHNLRPSVPGSPCLYLLSIAGGPTGLSNAEGSFLPAAVHQLFRMRD